MKLERAGKPQPGQVSKCLVCEKLAARTNKVETTVSGSGPVMVKEVIYCNVCCAETVLSTPLNTWPDGYRVVQHTQMQSMEPAYGSPPWRLSSNPPQILCSSCGEVLEKADDCYRCKCGREVRP